jgi:hypothetical protein
LDVLIPKITGLLLFDLSQIPPDGSEMSSLLSNVLPPIMKSSFHSFEIADDLSIIGRVISMISIFFWPAICLTIYELLLH